MEYIKVSQAAEKWGITPRRVRVLCAEGKIDGVIRKGKLYIIPENAAKPMDVRKFRTVLLLLNLCRNSPQAERLSSLQLAARRASISLKRQAQSFVR